MEKALNEFIKQLKSVADSLAKASKRMLEYWDWMIQDKQFKERVDLNEALNQYNQLNK